MKKPMTTVTSTISAIAIAALMTGCGALGATDANGDGIPDDATDQAGEVDPNCPEGAGKCFYGVELMDDLNNPTLAPTCDKGPPSSPGADIDGAVLADEEGMVFATLGQCAWKRVTTSCENDHATLSAAEGNVSLLEDGKPTNYYDPMSRSNNFEPAETKSGDYVALNGGSIQCAWLDIASGKPTYATDTDTIWVYEVGGSSSTKTEQFKLSLCKEATGECLSEKGFGAGVSAIPVKGMLPSDKPSS